MSSPKKVCIVGSGNWGSAIAKVVGKNVQKLKEFDTEIKMWVFEEEVNGRKLTEIINTDHENVKYLPGHKIPENVKAVPDLIESAKDADILIFVIPHQFLPRVCRQLVGIVKPNALGVSLIKGFTVKDGGGIDLISSEVENTLKIPCAVLMGANVANEVAAENYCEATIGFRKREDGLLLKRLFQADYFRIVVCEDEDTVELCGALKNIVATGAGFADGLGYGDNTKAAVIRLGLMEMVKFCEAFWHGTSQSTFLESCGVADLVTTCYAGRNRKVAAAFVNSGKTIEQLEQEMLNGQKLQGPPTAEEVNIMLKSKNMEDKFPLFTAVHKICRGEMPMQEFINCLKNHPEHM